MPKKLHISDDLCLAMGLQVIQHTSTRPITIFDVGANEGLFARRVQQQWSELNTRIYCFEPNPLAYAKLQDSVSDLKNTTTLQCGLSDQEEETVLYHPEKKTVLGSLIKRDVFADHERQWGKLVEEKVNISTIDNFLASNDVKQIDYLKIDTEGTELRVLKGAKEALQNKLISCGQFEYGGTFLDANITITDVVIYLEKFGYVIIDGIEGKVIQGNYPDDFKLNNFFFCRKELFRMT